jgi:branched-chain amino acid transport system substrate-binding protein
MKRSRRDLLKAAAALTLGTGIPGRAARGQQPVRVGLSIAQTGPISGGGRAALVALRMWADDINAKGGLLGRKVELVVYDDQGSASITPGIYAKLSDVDKVDLLIAPYGSVPTAPILPLAKQRKMVLMGQLLVPGECPSTARYVVQQRALERCLELVGRILRDRAGTGGEQHRLPRR